MASMARRAAVARGVGLAAVFAACFGLSGSSAFSDDPVKQLQDAARPAAAASAGVEFLKQFVNEDKDPAAAPVQTAPSPTPTVESAHLHIEAVVADERTEFEFTDTPLEEVLQFLGSKHGVNVLLDSTAISVAGVAKDYPVNMSVKGITLASGLNLLLQPLDLTYVVKDEVLMITTNDAARNKRETRIYDVRRLMQAGYDPKLLADVVRKVLQAQAGEPLSDDTAIVELPDGLVIYETQATHREVAKLLKLIEAHAASKPADTPAPPKAEATRVY